MVDTDPCVIDKISKPYMNYDHENKSTQKRYTMRHHLGYSHSDPPYKCYREAKRLRAAASCNDTERVKQLLERGADPNRPDEIGRTALHLACCRGFSDVVKLLLDHYADYNAVDKLGNTPLHLAVCTTSKLTVELLLKAGCCVSKRGNNGCTPLQLAQSKLMLFQTARHPYYEILKKEVSEVIEMMKKLVEEQSEEAELVNAFSSRLSLTQTSDEVVDDVKKLLEQLSSLNIDKRKTSSGMSRITLEHATV